MSQRLLTVGYYDPVSPRYVNLCQDLTEQGYEIVPIHTRAPGFIAKCRDLVQQFKAQAQPRDAMLITFPGHYLVPIFWLLTRWPRRQLLFDAFISLSDSHVSDRKLISWWHPKAWFLYLLDVVSCHLADIIYIDTKAHKKFFAKQFWLRPSKIFVSYVGTRNDLFTPGPNPGLLAPGKYNALFIGTYIPLQGIEYIIDAARILRDREDIHFTLIGQGQTRTQIENQVQELGLTNITFLDFQPIDQLPAYLRSCDVALGIFGLTDKADRVIPHKVYDAVGCGVPVITARNQAIEEQFTNGKEVYLCQPGNGESLAQVITELAH